MNLEQNMMEHLKKYGVKTGDKCTLIPFYGRKKELTLKWNKIDFLSDQYLPDDRSISIVELPNLTLKPFHYRLEIFRNENFKSETYHFKTIKGQPFLFNGVTANDVYVEKTDKIQFANHSLHFYQGMNPLSNDIDNPILKMEGLMMSDLNILIEGETGTGKTHLARAIHEKSQKTGPFISVNLSAYNLGLIESELFGHKRGAFTGAHTDKIGAFEAAEGGTLFLDEIDSLPLEIQTKILTFLDNKSYRSVGDIKEKKINTRFIFASGKSLEQMVKMNQFRKDFYFRIKSGYSVHLASLREEATLIKNACDFYSLKNNVQLTSNLENFYKTLPWPGNLRQLFGHLEKKKVFSKTQRLDFDSIDEQILVQSSNLVDMNDQINLSMEDFKISHFFKTYTQCMGNLSLTAKKLNISFKTARSFLIKINSQEHK